MSQRLVSVVMGTYNGAEFLRQQIDSILNQSWRPLELIISDDASVDDTRMILKEFEHHSLVRIFYQDKNLGLPGNYSFAASRARGDLIAFADQDDIWISDKIEKLVSSMDNYPLVYSDSILIDEKGEEMGQKLSDWKRMYSGSDSRGYFLYSCVWGHGMMITKSLLEKSLPIPESIHHDIWIVYQAFQHGGIKYVDEPLTYYRQKTPNSSKTKDSRYNAYREKLNWLTMMKTHERPQFQPFYEELHNLYGLKGKNGYVFPLVSFMLRHRKAIFQLSRKNFMSQFIEILKQARPERNS